MQARSVQARMWHTLADTIHVNTHTHTHTHARTSACVVLETETHQYQPTSHTIAYHHYHPIRPLHTRIHVVCLNQPRALWCIKLDPRGETDAEYRVQHMTCVVRS